MPVVARTKTIKATFSQAVFITKFGFLFRRNAIQKWEKRVKKTKSICGAFVPDKVKMSCVLKILTITVVCSRHLSRWKCCSSNTSFLASGCPAEPFMLDRVTTASRWSLKVVIMSAVRGPQRRCQSSKRLVPSAIARRAATFDCCSRDSRAFYRRKHACVTAQRGETKYSQGRRKLSGRYGGRHTNPER